MNDLSVFEVEQVSGAMSDFTTGGIAVISIGFATPVTAPFGLLVGGAMLIVGYYQG